MRKIILNDETFTEFKPTTPDIGEFNKELLGKGFDNIKSFQVISKGKKVKVDLKDATISIDGIEQDLDLSEDEKTKLKGKTIKWINFRRVTVSMRMDGNKSRKTNYGIGFQGEVDGKNIKRFILLGRDSKELKK